MRFYLDNDTDYECARRLRAKGHDCWSASEAGLAEAADTDQMIYACDMGATLITHDQGFAGAQRERGFGRLILLNCVQPDGPDLIEAAIDEILPTLRAREFVVVEVRPASILTHHSGWS